MKGKPQEAPLCDDLLDGVDEISAVTGWPKRSVYASAHELPLFKFCGRWQGRKSTLRRYIERLEAAAGRRTPPPNKAPQKKRHQ